MKRTIIAVLCLVSISCVYGQDMSTETSTLNYNSLEKKLDKSNEDILDEKASAKASTWEKRGEILQDCHDVNTDLLRLGMSETEVKLFPEFRETNEIKKKEENGVVTEEYVYDRITLIFENGVLQNWKETKVIHEDPLPEALKAYKKALELDDKGKIDKKIKEDLDRLKLQAENDAIRHFTRQEYVDALRKFELIMDISKVDLYEGYIDTVIVYNAALAARNAGDHKKAAHYFEKAAELGYGGSDTYYLLKTEYMALQDTAKALQTLEKGYELYPDSTIIIFELVNYHLQAGNSEEGMKYLNAAEQIAGDNPSIYFAKGTLFEKLGDKEKAMEAYREALRIDPEFFNAWFNIGALYFNQAVEMYEKANSIEDLDDYNKAKAAADEVLRKSIEPLEKAHQLLPTDKSTLETLSTIYYRLQMMDKRDEVKARLDALKAGN